METKNEQDKFDKQVAEMLPCRWITTGPCAEKAVRIVDGVPTKISDYHWEECPAFRRTAVAAALREQGQENERLKAAIYTSNANVLRAQDEIAQLRAQLADFETDQKILEDIYAALDGLPISGERTGPKSVKYLGAAEQITRLRAQLAALHGKMMNLSYYSNNILDRDTRHAFVEMVAELCAGMEKKL